MATYLETLLALAQQGQPANGLPPIPAPAQPVAMPAVFQPPVTVGPPGPAPEPAPMAPMPALDANFVNQYAGARPAEPVQRQPSFIDKLSTALLGVSAGLQGRAPQYIESVREERERPQREYRQQLKDYEERRTRGLEIATRKQEQQQARTQEVADRNADREFQQWLKRTGVTDEIAIQQMRQAFEIQKLRESERIGEEKLAAQQKEINDRQARSIEYNLASGQDAAPPKIAKEIAQYIINGTPMSPVAEKWRNAQVEKIRTQIARLTGRGGGGSGAGQSMAQQKAVERFEGVKQQYADAVSRNDARAQKELQKKMVQAHNALTRFPGLELGYDPSGKWPYQKPRGQAQAPAPQQQQSGPMMAQPVDSLVQEYMQRWGITDRNQAIRELTGQP